MKLFEVKKKYLQFIQDSVSSVENLISMIMLLQVGGSGDGNGNGTNCIFVGKMRCQRNADVIFVRRRHGSYGLLPSFTLPPSFFTQH